MKKVIKEEIINIANDPSSFEFVSFDLIDTVYEPRKIFADSINIKKIIKDSSYNEQTRRFLIDSIYNEKTIEIPTYKVLYSFRLKNGFGATMLNYYCFELREAGGGFYVVNKYSVEKGSN